ncbi:hypothetical protein ITJ86_16955 [Winogradskyella sp. F6397]|uniref:Protein NO VEIN C-terminal domain-containing protein n=2 Tax=Winogradskyella marina TaxID=2785530 RepID=A0ABS0EMS5_9FLAO|nr:hypothetical protein [Winogradskyella marina]
MREITHIIGDVFGDLSIPEKFSSSEDLITQAKTFIDHLKSFESYFIESVEKLNSASKSIPVPIPTIDGNRKRTIEVFEKFVNLAETESNLREEVLTKIYNPTELEKIENLLKKFHSVANQLKSRRKEDGKPRETILIKDEYDVQDLIHGLLKIHFDDIRAEEWKPSYAGSSKRSDFLLKNEQIVIEIKKTRINLKDKQIGEQLIIDKANYRKHSDCKTLICFVYDPELRIKNPIGIINDLKVVSTDFTTLVYILPNE